MAVKFVVPQVAQYTVNGRFQGRAVANVIAMAIDTTGTAENRADAVTDQAGIILNQWHTQMLPKVSILYTAETVSWIDLNSETGSVGVRNVASTHTWPAPGGNTSAPMPGNVSYLVKKHTSAARGARAGRMYVCGTNELETQPTGPNVIDPTIITAWNTMLSSFKDNLEQETNPLSYTSKMAVVHILTRAPVEPGKKPPGAPLTGNFTQVSSLTLDSLLATQRRRLRG